MKTSTQIRQDFLDYFVKKHGHTFVPSSPVVPLDDPTLLFTNAGMNQFKPIFLGQEKREYTRAANTQKCIRAGGKHNDLDDVGRSRRHHTFFEMLGNWSFGDYFKRGAIEMAWELLTKVWGLDPARLHASCYEGDEKAGIPRDTEAADLWKQIAGLPDDHIHYFGKDNFWEMGDTGPCGPCTEIYYDRTPDKSGGPQVNGSDPRVMEIWNLVFIQYNRDSAGKLTPLPSQHVDTGMGFERICQVLQGKEDNYGTDLWTPLFEKISEISTLKYTGLFPKTNSVDPQAEAANEQLRHDIAFRVVADHVRCLTFALTDGAVPSNEGRGYVLRRILRRAVRFGKQQLGLSEPFLHQLIPVVVDSMSGAFPELKKNPERMIELIKDEEISFAKTLDRGLVMFEREVVLAAGRTFAETLGSNWELSSFGGGQPGEMEMSTKETPTSHFVRTVSSVISKLNFWDKDTRTVKTILTSEVLAGLPANTKLEISGEGVFRLHDTYGFPIDLTRIMAEERGMTVDVAGYEKLMEQARELARAGGKDTKSDLFELAPNILNELKINKVAPTDDSFKFTDTFVRSKALAIWDGANIKFAPASVDMGKRLAIILDRTNFYAEMGGQVGDGGFLADYDGAFMFNVETTRAAGGYVLHVGRLTRGSMTVGDVVDANVGATTRCPTMNNHTGTHIANWALREILGDGVQQKGSLVDPEKLRFDFSQSKALTDDEIAKVEELVNQAIQKELPVYAEEAPQEKALKINGLRAVFGEKYPPMVRVVSVGVPVSDLLADPENPKWRQYSIEFCGGTHLVDSQQIGQFTVIAEESVSKGIRRIVALTGNSAAKVIVAGQQIEQQIAAAQKAADANLQPLISSLQQAVSEQIPLLVKRKAQAAITELHSRFKAYSKSSKTTAGPSGVDAIAAAGHLLSSAIDIAGGKLIVGKIDGVTDDQLRSAVDSLKKKAPNHAILLGAADEQKVTFVAAVSDDLIAKGLKAGDWLKQVAAVAGGGGGGRPQMAQGSGKEPGKLTEALKAAVDVAKKLIQ